MSAAEKKHRPGVNSRKRPPSGQPTWIRWLGAAVLAFLALHSLSYGIGFISSPVDGAREFGDDTPPSEAAQHLASLVGILLLLLAATAAVAAGLLLRDRPGGAWLALGLGIAMLSIAGYWAALGSRWDVGIYGSFGLLITGAGAVSLRYAARNTKS